MLYRPVSAITGTSIWDMFSFLASVPNSDDVITFQTGGGRFSSFPHTDVYWKSPCDADLLAGCVTANSGIQFVDLDEASFYSFYHSARYSENRTKAQIVLYYQPSIFDEYFVPPHASTPWISNYNVTVEPIVGRVNCDKMPLICQNELFPDDHNALPQVQVIIPTKQNRRVQSSTTTNQYLYPPPKSKYRNKSYWEERLQDDYGPLLTQCMWRRFGAELLQPACQDSLKDYYFLHVSKEYGLQPQALPFIQEGQRIAFTWNCMVVLACGLLLVALGLAGKKLVHKCLVQYCCSVSAFENSASLTKTERQAQVRKHEQCFMGATVILGVFNLFLPMLTMLLGGSVAIGCLFWIWYAEFHCCRPMSIICILKYPTNESNRKMDTTTGDKVVPLLSSTEEA